MRNVGRSSSIPSRYRIRPAQTKGSSDRETAQLERGKCLVKRRGDKPASLWMFDKFARAWTDMRARTAKSGRGRRKMRTQYGSRLKALLWILASGPGRMRTEADLGFRRDSLYFCDATVVWKYDSASCRAIKFSGHAAVMRVRVNDAHRS